MPDTRVGPQADPSAIDLRQYRIFEPPDPFEDHIGPIYHRIDGDTLRANSVHCVLPTGGKLANAGGSLHGGALLTFADYALCLVAGRAADGGSNSSFALTVSLTAEFFAAGEIGPSVEARGEPLRVTGSLAFARGSVVQGGRTLMTWSGTCRHIARAKAMARKAGASEKPRAPARAAGSEGPPAGYGPILRSSPFTELSGPIWYRKPDEGAIVDVVQPTHAFQANSGGVIHGGMLMTFADNAVCTTLAAITGKAPSTVTFSAEFLSAGEVGPVLETRVEVSHATQHLGFARGTVTQGERILVNYNMVAALRDWAGKPAGK